jgi:hypothetical protein
MGASGSRQPEPVRRVTVQWCEGKGSSKGVHREEIIPIGIDFPEQVDKFMKQHGDRILHGTVTILVQVGWTFPVQGFLKQMYGEYWLGGRLSGLYVQALIIDSAIPEDAPAQYTTAEYASLKEDAGEWWQGVKNAATFMGLVFRNDANVTLRPFYSNSSALGSLNEKGYFGPNALQGLVFERDQK